MLPLYDRNPTSSTPYMTIALIVANIGIFLLQGTNAELRYGFLPAKLTSDRAQMEATLAKGVERPLTDRFGNQLFDPIRRVPLVVQAPYPPDVVNAITAVPAWATLVSCMFLHGGWMHLLGNMLYLWIFGNNIEDRLGPLLFAVFYLGTGIVGTLAHTFVAPPGGLVPLVGASGAISGVMGAYILLYPHSRITAMVPLGFYPLTINLPAWIFLGIYVLLQNIYPQTFGAGKESVAYMAHIGGFIAGMVLIYAFPLRPVPEGASRANEVDENADIVI